MAQVARITLRTVEHAELVHDTFDEAMVDGRLDDHEVVDIRRLLDLNLVSASAADCATTLAVGANRGVINTRHAKALMQDFIRLDEQVHQLEATFEDPLYPDAA